MNREGRPARILQLIVEGVGWVVVSSSQRSTTTEHDCDIYAHLLPLQMGRTTATAQPSDEALAHSLASGARQKEQRKGTNCGQHQNFFFFFFFFFLFLHTSRATYTDHGG